MCVIYIYIYISLPSVTTIAIPILATQEQMNEWINDQYKHRERERETHAGMLYACYTMKWQDKTRMNQLWSDPHTSNTHEHNRDRVRSRTKHMIEWCLTATKATIQAYTTQHIARGGNTRGTRETPLKTKTDKTKEREQEQESGSKQQSSEWELDHINTPPQQPFT